MKKLFKALLKKLAKISILLFLILSIGEVNLIKYEYNYTYSQK